MDFKVKGGNLPVLICSLDRGEAMVTQAGGMSWHTQGIEVETKGKGGIGKMFGRALAGESMFQNIYRAHEDNQEIAFASNFPGDILAVDVTPTNSLIIQKQSFLASTVEVETEMFFQKKISSGLFGGEGFVMLKLKGQGQAFLEVDGSVHEYTLDPGEKLYLDTGHLVAMDTTCTLSVETAGNIKSMFLGGEGFFNTVVVGPGKVYVQSMPINRIVLMVASQVQNNNR